MSLLWVLWAIIVIYGKTLNPYDNSKSAGGSSSGSAASVGGGIAIASLGTDTGGSIRQPASYCGCVGFKPSYGRVSRYGIAAYASSFDQCGTLTQSVYDSAILYDAISGYDAKDSTSANISYESITKELDNNDNAKYNIAVLPTFIKNAHKDIQNTYNNTINKLKELGHNIIEVEFDEKILQAQLSAYYIIACGEATTNLARYDGIRYGNRIDGKDLEETYINSRTQGFSLEVKKRIMLGNFVLSSGYYDAYYTKAQKVRELVKQQFNNIFTKEGADLILSPITPTTAPKFGSYKSSLEMYLSDIYTIGVNLASLPAISVPCDRDSDGMPIGLQLIAKQFDESTLFKGAISLEEISNFKSDFFSN